MNEPYSPGGEHCPKCGYRHDGRCAEAQCQRDLSAQTVGVALLAVESEVQRLEKERNHLQAELATHQKAAEEYQNQLRADWSKARDDYDALAAEVRRITDDSFDEVLLLASRRTYDVGFLPAIAKALKETSDDRR